MAATASSSVATLATTISPASTLLASLQLFSGARKSSAPPSRAPSILCVTPPIGPTEPSSEMVPVPATCLPPLSSPGESLSMTASEKIIPALGPPTSLKL